MCTSGIKMEASAESHGNKPQHVHSVRFKSWNGKTKIAVPVTGWS